MTQASTTHYSKIKKDGSAKQFTGETKENAPTATVSPAHASAPAATSSSSNVPTGSAKQFTGKTKDLKPSIEMTMLKCLRMMSGRALVSHRDRIINNLKICSLLRELWKPKGGWLRCLLMVRMFMFIFVRFTKDQDLLTASTTYIFILIRLLLLFLVYLYCLFISLYIYRSAVYQNIVLYGCQRKLL